MTRFFTDRITLNLFWFILFVLSVAIAATAPSVAKSLLDANQKQDSTKAKIAREIGTLALKNVNELGLYWVRVGLHPANFKKSLQYPSKKIVMPGRKVHIRQIDYADEVIRILVNHFSQAPVLDGTPAKQDSGFIRNVCLPVGRFLLAPFQDKKSDSSRVPKSNEISRKVQTEISLTIEIFDTNSAQAIETFYVDVYQEGESPAESKLNALDVLDVKIKYELKKIYSLFSDILPIDQHKIRLFIGKNFNLNKGMVFELVEPDRFYSHGGQQYLLDGGRVGFAKITEVYQDSSEAEVFRAWQTIQPGCEAILYPDLISGLQMSFIPSTTQGYTQFNALLQFNLQSKTNWGISAQYVQIRDSFGEKNHGFGFGAFGYIRFLTNKKYSMGFHTGLDLDIFYKVDFEDVLVNAVLPSVHLGLNMSILTSSSRDIVLYTGYRFGIPTNKWEDNDGEETIPATWDDKAPRINNSGFFVSIGYRFVLF